MNYKRKLTCRPCKERNDWEIETPDGEVLNKHYNTKSECLRAAHNMAEEYGYEVEVQEYFSNR